MMSAARGDRPQSLKISAVRFSERDHRIVGIHRDHPVGNRLGTLRLRNAPGFTYDNRIAMRSFSEFAYLIHFRMSPP